MKSNFQILIDMCVEAHREVNMKTKIIIGILSMALLFSVGGNVWLYRSAAEAETLQGKIAELEGKEAEQQAKVSGLEEQIAGYEAQISELQKTLKENEKATALSQVCYTTDQTDDESLIQLVKDTITSASIEIKYAKEAEQSRTKSLLESVEDACKRDDLESTFAMLNPVAAEGGAEITYVPEDWTFLQAAGGVGGVIFHRYELEEVQITESNMLKYFIANGMYNFDVTQLDSFEIADESGMTLVDVNDDKFDVNFTVTFTNKGNGVEYVALIGNVNGGYVVLDAINAEDVEKLNRENNYENSTVGVNAGGAESFIPDDDPSVNPDVMNEDPGEEYIPGTGGLTITEMDASDMPMAPGFDGNTEFDPDHNYDPNNPDYMPGMY